MEERIVFGVNAVYCRICGDTKIKNKLQKCTHCGDTICGKCGYCECSYKSFREEKRLEKYRLEVIQNHKVFIQKLNIAYSGFTEPNQIKKNRITVCYNCKQSLDNKVHFECSNCSWIICKCGACGCGYQKLP